MKIDNPMSFMTTQEAKKGKVYLAVTEDKKLYIIKQVGARSWDAFNMDVMAGTEHIHSSRIMIIEEARKQLDVDYICEFSNQDKVGFRKSVFEFNAYGTIGMTNFEIIKEEK